MVVCCLQFTLKLQNDQRLFLFTDQIQRQRPDICCLMPRLDRPVLSNKVLIICCFDLFRQQRIVLCILCPAENFCHMAQIVTRTLRIGCCHLRFTIPGHMAYIIRCCTALCKKFNDLWCSGKRFIPLSIMEFGIIYPFPVTVCIPRFIIIQRVFILHTAQGIIQPFFCCIIVFLQNSFIPIHQIELIRNPYGRISPANTVLANITVSRRASQCHGKIRFLYLLQFLRIMDA